MSQENKHPAHPAEFTYDSKHHTLFCLGAWTTTQLSQLDSVVLPALTTQDTHTVSVDGKDIQYLDTAGAWLLCRLLQPWREAGVQIHLINFHPEHDALFKLIERKSSVTQAKHAPKQFNIFYRVGKASVQAYEFTLRYLHFVGLTTVYLFSFFKNLEALRRRYTLKTIENTGVSALPIVGLLTFLIGVVLAYQSGIILEDYGAEVYVIDLIGIAMLREFGPLITAIIAAGRTSSAFTAEIGLMKVNEEIDALRTLGLSPVEIVAVPKVIGLIIALPLLTMWGNIFGIFGGMIMSTTLFDFSYADFLHQFRQNVDLRHFYLGICKVPVFAFLISTVGCFHGFQVRGSAESVGNHTTTSVVQSLFLIIVADSMFSIVFSWYNL
jgi:phospholipid/cholesterol/gamma-HCH transport system permease protein